MPNIIKNKPTKKLKKTFHLPSKGKPTKHILTKKQSTLAYYDCLIDEIANPINEKTKITSLAHHCKCNKGKVAIAQKEHKQKLLKAVAKDYKAFGQSLGHYLQADVIGCLQDKK